MMHAELLTLGFVRTAPGTYFSAEFSLTIHTTADKNVVEVLLGDGKIVTATLTELEDALMSGSFGGFGI